jgi:mono/diheme cytochrome c family protein
MVFMHQCNQCHILGGPGLGPGLNDKPLPALAIKTQVRQGIGTMPAFSESDISNEQLDALVTYMQELRQQESPLARR